MYSEGGECEEFTCPLGCGESQYDEKSGNCVCTNCDIPCYLEGQEFVNRSCLPSTGTGEWTCGVEIPIGEVIDRSVFLAGKILAAFGGEIESGKEMAVWGDRILEDYQKWNCAGYNSWEDKPVRCETDCYKFYSITAGVLQSGQPDEATCKEELGQEISRGKSVYPKECNEDYTQCVSCNEHCSQTGHKEECCWNESLKIEVPDPKKPEKTIEKTIFCKYCKKEDDGETKYCSENCYPWTCYGCCQQYFQPIINGYTNIVNLQEALKNDIEETNATEKFKRSYILEQLDFSRCELSKCWISAEDYYDVLEGKKVGKHLISCEAAERTGLFDEDQTACFTTQIINEWEEVSQIWAELETASWWQKPFIAIKLYFEFQWRIIWLTGKTLLGMIKGQFDAGQEEGCYPTNYYCCQM